MGYPFLVVGEHRTPAQAGILITLLILGATVATWTAVLAWPGRAPLALLVVLIVVLASNGPGSLMGFDYAPPAACSSIRFRAPSCVSGADDETACATGP